MSEVWLISRNASDGSYLKWKGDVSESWTDNIMQAMMFRSREEAENCRLLCMTAGVVTPCASSYERFHNAKLIHSNNKVTEVFNEAVLDSRWNSAWV